MRSKTILSTAAFVIAFVFSSVFANLFVEPNVSEPLFTTKTSLVESNYGTQQQEMLDFLKQDRRYGYELSREIYSADQSDSEEMATLRLTRKMRRLDDSAMPSDFRDAWENHVRAWEDYADSLYRANRMTKNESKENLIKRNNEINRTYYVLLKVARQYGVNFSN